MKIITTHSDTIDTELYGKLLKFVQDIAREDPRGTIVRNMGLDSSAGLLFNIEKKWRWKQGEGEIALLVTGTDDTIIGVSCVESSPIEVLSIGGIRTWVTKPYRSKNVITNQLLSSNLDWSISNGKSGMMLTFNDYNRWIYEGIRKKVNGQSPGLAGVWSDWWNDCLPISQQVVVRNVKQWCVIKPTGITSASSLRSMMENLDVIGR